MSRLLLLSLALMVGCSPPAAVTIGTDHPANPEAPVGAGHAALPEVRTVHLHGHASDQHPAPAAAREAPALYRCPMHPEVTSTNPEERCPKCGMKINEPTSREPQP